MAKASALTTEVSASDVATEAAGTAVATTRPKRVRTGCLTCRERHLKCDEGLPDCVNCQKSGRLCKRGVRLNFIDTTVRSPPITPPSDEWDVTFLDESRAVASEYKGGAERYSSLSDAMDLKDDREFDFTSSVIDAPVLAHQRLPPQQPSTQQPFAANNMELFPASLSIADPSRDSHQRHNSTASDSAFSSNTLASSSITYTNGDQTLTPPGETRQLLTDPDELLYMQVFVEEVAIWMDSMDSYKHVSVSDCRFRTGLIPLVFSPFAFRLAW